MPKNIYTDMIALMGDPDTIEGLFPYEATDEVDEAEREAKEDELKVKSERGD